MKKIFASILAALMFVSVVPAALAVDAPSFSDVPATHWAFNEIEQAVDKGITNGYADGTFKPANSVTKNQFAVMLSRAFFPEDVAANQEIDDGQPWYWANLQTLYEKGLLEGTDLEEPSNWASRGGYSITRYDMAQLMANIMAAGGKTVSESEKETAAYNIHDWQFIAADRQGAVATCYVLGILNGQSDGTFGGASPMNRAQGCVVIGRMANVMDGTAAPVEISKGTLANGKPITVENVLERLEEIKELYPDGTIYMPVGETYGTRALTGRASSASECAGWAAMVSDMIFGKGEVNPSHELIDHSKIRPGDIIGIYEQNDPNWGKDNPGHWMLVISEAMPVEPYNNPDGTWIGYGITESGSTHIVSWYDSCYGDQSDIYGLYADVNFCENFDEQNGGAWVVYTRYPD